MNDKPLVGILMGSDSDLPLMTDAAKIIEEFSIPYEITIISAHRTPDKMMGYGKSAEKRGLKVIIAGAGGAAHVAGVTAALTTLPVIGVPIKTKTMDGLDSLLSIVQMPPGIPVATVAINGAKNAGLLAVRILALNDSNLLEKLNTYVEKMKDTVMQKAKELEKEGFKNYLEKLNK